MRDRKAEIDRWKQVTSNTKRDGKEVEEEDGKDDDDYEEEVEVVVAVVVIVVVAKINTTN